MTTITNAAIVYDATSFAPLMIVVPDHDGQLSDPAYNPAGSAQLLVPLNLYNKLSITVVPPPAPPSPYPAPPAASPTLAQLQTSQADLTATLNSINAQIAALQGGS